MSHKFSLLDIHRLWDVATTAASTASHLTIIANLQYREARRAALEIISELSDRLSTEPWEHLEDVVLDSPESRDFVGSLIEFVRQPEFTDRMWRDHQYSHDTIQQTFGLMDDPPTSHESVSGADDQSNDEGHILDAQGRMDVDPPLPGPSRQQHHPAIAASPSIRSLRDVHGQHLSRGSISSSAVSQHPMDGRSISPSALGSASDDKRGMSILF
jgi:hypothetical protein